MINRKLAFTLAEVLITVGIIGVVAAMIMPTIINNARQKELEANFKKKSAELQNALQMVQHDEGMTIYGNITSFRPHNANNYKVTIADVLAKQFKSAKILNQYAISSNMIDGKTHFYQNYSGSADFPPGLLDDGTIMVNKEFFIFINNDNHWLTNQEIYIDTNGYKGPNRYGHDLFKFCLSEGDKLNFGCGEYTQKALTQKDYFTNLPK